MKIAQLVFLMGSGGDFTLVKDLAMHFKLNNHTLDLIVMDRFSGSPYETKYKEILEKMGVTIYSLGRTPKSKLSAVNAVKRLILLQMKNKYDVIHTHAPSLHKIAGFINTMLFRSLRHVATIHNTREGWDKIATLMLRKSKVVFCSQAADETQSVTADSVVITNGVHAPKSDFSEEEKNAKRKSLNLPANSKVLLSVGNLRKQKNYHLAISVIKKIVDSSYDNEVHYLICGSGYHKEAIEQEIQQFSLGNRIHLLGTRTDVPELLGIADCFLSTSNYEGLPLAVLEAFFAGAKCVLSPIKEHYDISKGVYGCFIPEQATENQYVQEIMNAFDVNESSREIIVKRQDVIAKYSSERMAKEYEELYYNLNKSR